MRDSSDPNVDPQHGRASRTESTRPRTVAALAGRRPDEEGASPPRFPLRAATSVQEALHDLFGRENVQVLVCSAACGADIIALTAARDLGLRRRVVLPFAPDAFVRTSVVDRPGDWEQRYWDVIEEVRAAGDLVVLDGDPEVDESYAAASAAILREAIAIAGSDDGGTGAARLMAIAVWEGAKRQDGKDETASLLNRARKAGAAIREVSTLPKAGRPRR